MNLDKLIIKLQKQGWTVDKDFLEHNEEYLQELVNEAEKEALILFGVRKSDYCSCDNQIKIMDIEGAYHCENCKKIIIQ